MRIVPSLPPAKITPFIALYKKREQKPNQQSTDNLSQNFDHMIKMGFYVPSKGKMAVQVPRTGIDSQSVYISAPSESWLSAPYPLSGDTDALERQPLLQQNYFPAYVQITFRRKLAAKSYSSQSLKKLRLDLFLNFKKIGLT